jgi:hypothetical protein
MQENDWLSRHQNRAMTDVILVGFRSTVKSSRRSQYCWFDDLVVKVKCPPPYFIDGAILRLLRPGAEIVE